MRAFCSACHRPSQTCFCAQAQPFVSQPELALLVHPTEVKSTVGTAWILRRSIANLRWLRTNGLKLDHEPRFIEWLHDPKFAPVLLYPGVGALELDSTADAQWQALIPAPRQPLLIVIDGTWAQAKAMLKRSALLRDLPRVSFAQAGQSEYVFKRQPAPECLSSVETVHRILEVLARRGWVPPAEHNAHDQMLVIFREMVRKQVASKPQFSPSLSSTTSVSPITSPKR